MLVVSDIHGNQYAWRAFLEQIQRIKYDRMVFLGDIFGYYYGQSEIINGLSKFKNLVWLKGNHDQYFLDMLAGTADIKELTTHYGSTYQRVNISRYWICRMDSLPTSYTLKMDKINLLFCHGTPENLSDGRRYPGDNWEPSDCGQFDVVICGHTHFRMAREGGGKQWLNAGSLGQPRDGNESGFLLYDTETRQYDFVDVPYDKTPLYREIQQNDPTLHKLTEILKRKKQ